LQKRKEEKMISLNFECFVMFIGLPHKASQRRKTTFEQTI
jgi:hypothetical protein